MPRITAKIFRDGRNQAVRIPVELSFDTDTVSLEKRSDALILRPHRKGGWDAFFADPSLRLSESFDTGDDPLP